MTALSWRPQHFDFAIKNESPCQSCRLVVRWAVGTALVIGIGVISLAAERPKSEWVYPGPDGKLVYKVTSAGDRIMDFSHAGYRGGGVALPVVAVKRTLQPSGSNDETAAIQAAINEVAAMHPENGFRGAVLLAPGVFPCSETITIPASGVVLRGSGSGTEPGQKTTLQMTSKPHLAIAVRLGGERGPGSAQRGNDDGTDARQKFLTAETSIADEYVPSGTTAFTVANSSGFAAGDTIELRRPVTPAWIKFMRMDDLVRDGRPQTWLRAGTTTTTERHLSAIAGNRFTLDVPVSDSFDSRYLQPPGTIVAKIRPPSRITEAGIEQLHIECPPQPISHTRPHFTALRINGQDCWVRDVVCDETMNSVAVSGQRITLQRVIVNRKARHQGSSRPAEFAPNAGQVLLDRCEVNADNIWFVASGARQAGPIVLLNCAFAGDSRAESHQRWSTGMLYDNCRVPQGGIEFRNRGSMGSGHGWTMGWGVAWNCVAREYVIQNPPGAVNWMVGCIGESARKPRPFGNGPLLPGGIQDSPGKPVTPQSLYLAQLAERLGSQAVKNIGETEANSVWRALPLVTNGHVDESWSHVGWGGFVVDGDSLRTECDPKGLGLLVYKKERLGNCQLRVVFKSKDSKSNSGVFVRIADGILDQVSRPGAAFDRDASGKISKPSAQRMMTSAEREEGPWFAVHRGYEVQIMDANDKLHRTGAIYSLAPSSAVPDKPPGEWKTMVITLSGTHVFVELDGQRVTSFDPESPEVPSKRQWFESKREPKRPELGYIGLQNHDPGDVVWFREVSVRPLPNSTSSYHPKPRAESE